VLDERVHPDCSLSYLPGTVSVTSANAVRVLHAGGAVDRIRERLAAPGRVHHLAVEAEATSARGTGRFVVPVDIHLERALQVARGRTVGGVALVAEADFFDGLALGV